MDCEILCWDKVGFEHSCHSSFSLSFQDGFYVKESSAHMWEHVCMLPRAEITVSPTCEAVQEAVCWHFPQEPGQHLILYSGIVFCFGSAFLIITYKRQLFSVRYCNDQKCLDCYNSYPWATLLSAPKSSRTCTWPQLHSQVLAQMQAQT